MQALVASVAREDEISLINSDIAYEVWSPYDADEGADRLYQFLSERGRVEP